MSDQITYKDVDSWDLPTGDRVVIRERIARTWGLIANQDVVVRSYTFHVQAANGRKIAGGGETYVSKYNAQRAARRSFPAVES